MCGGAAASVWWNGIPEYGLLFDKDLNCYIGKNYASLLRLNEPLGTPFGYEAG